jgi:hypothetical protein
MTLHKFDSLGLQPNSVLGVFGDDEDFVLLVKNAGYCTFRGVNGWHARFLPEDGDPSAGDDEVRGAVLVVMVLDGLTTEDLEVRLYDGWEGEEGICFFMVIIEAQGNLALPFSSLPTTLLPGVTPPSPV